MTPSRLITRRSLLRRGLGALGGLGLVCWSGRVWPIGPGSKFRFGQLSWPGLSNPRPGALNRLARELEKFTSIDVGYEPVIVAPSDSGLHEVPFLYLSGDRGFAPLSKAHVAALRRHLTFGGFLLIDSAEGRLGGELDASVRRLCADIFTQPLVTLDKEHVIYRSFYLLDEPVGRLRLGAGLEAIVHDGRVVVAYSQDDLAGAWMRDDLGDFTYPCYPGGERQRQLAFRLGVNIVVYALCLDYKSDQVHIPFILKRRQWRVEE